MTGTVLITGCSTGFGRMMVPEMTRRGWTVLAGVRGGRSRAPDLQAEVIDLDITDGGQRKRAIASLPRLDCLINNAGVGMFGPFEETSEEELRAIMETNFMATALLTRECLPLLRASRGRIITLSSVFGFVAPPLTSMYSASKFALEGWSESLTHELRPHGVRVTLVEPGAYRTSFGESSRWPAAPLPEYAAQREGMLAFRKRRTSGKGNAAEIVARAIAELASSNRAPMRFRLGSDSRSLWFLRKWLPEPISDRLLGRLFSRLMGQGR